MKRIPTFVAGMLTAAVIGGLGVGALAASGAVTFNASNLMFNGQQISAKGEGYTLDNGCQAPASITYTDEKGGGTTYLPVRRISELLDVETGWDGATGSVTVGKAADTTAPSTDYSKWSVEEEAAYQDFKGIWTERVKNIRTAYVYYDYSGDKTEVELKNYLNELGKDTVLVYSERMIKDFIVKYNSHNFVAASYFYSTTAQEDEELWYANYSIDHLDEATSWYI